MSFGFNWIVIDRLNLMAKVEDICQGLNIFRRFLLLCDVTEPIAIHQLLKSKC